MARFLRSNAAIKGKAPGSMVFIGDHKMAQSVIRRIHYDGGSIDEDRPGTFEAALEPHPSSVTWVNIDGLEDTVLMREIQQRLGIDPLHMDAILNTDERSTFCDAGSYLFILVKMLRFEGEDRVIAEQLSLILLPGLLVTFQERTGDVFEPVRERLRHSQGRIRGAKADYLAYALLDTVLDNYIHIIERLGERVEDVDEEVLEGQSGDDLLERITVFKREMNYLRKAIRPAREALLGLAKVDSDLVQDATLPFLRDLYDLGVQAGEAIDTYRDMLSDQLNTYRTAVGTKLNEIMKVLTIFAAIFIPLTFIAGVYGTNFVNVPELHYRYGYYAMWVVMLGVVLLMVRYFRRKGWL